MPMTNFPNYKILPSNNKTLIITTVFRVVHFVNWIFIYSEIVTNVNYDWKRLTSVSGVWSISVDSLAPCQIKTFNTEGGTEKYGQQ